MTSLVERLRAKEEFQTWYDGGYRHFALTNPDGPEAADKIESLERENAELREWRQLLGNQLQNAIADCTTTRLDALEEAAKVVEEGFDRGIRHKGQTCQHGKFAWEDCESCAVVAIRALAGKEA